MARLNEPPMSTDNIETLRRKMLRQNRELAKCNNVRALRIRELEGELACAISENLELRGRILELEKVAEDNDARRIADHALDIKAKLESQLAEWRTMLAGLGVEPPMKRHSPRAKKQAKPRMSFSSNRPSPSQRRLQHVARDVEELGHISEHKTYSRQSLSPEQISALRNEPDASESQTSLKPSKRTITTDDEPVKIDSPRRPEQQHSTSSLLNSPVRFPSPINEKSILLTTSPRKKSPPSIKPDEAVLSNGDAKESSLSRSVRAGAKRKLDLRDDTENILIQRLSDDSQELKAMAEKISIRDKAYGKTLKELATMRKDAKVRQDVPKPNRKPLAAKNVNQDINSPRKVSRERVVDEISEAKADLAKTKPASERLKPKAKNIVPIPSAVEDVTSVPVSISAQILEQVITDRGLLFADSHSPEGTPLADDDRSDTPPPADISLHGEASRPSRRNRTAVSYAEPNLRDKMRRPTKELFDAVAGEGKSRRWSQSGVAILDGQSIKRESMGDVLKNIPLAKLDDDTRDESPSIRRPAAQDTQLSVPSTKKKRPSSSERRALDFAAELSKDDGAGSDDGESAELDVYEFESSSPQLDESTISKARSTRNKSSRRFSAAVDNDSAPISKDRTNSRRRSMVV